MSALCSKLRSNTSSFQRCIINRHRWVFFVFFFLICEFNTSKQIGTPLFSLALSPRPHQYWEKYWETALGEVSL